jgi:hypothetical protein
VQGLLGAGPVPVHPQGRDRGARRGDLNEVAHALHVRLPGEDPEIADKDGADRERRDVVILLQLPLDGMRSRRDARELAIDVPGTSLPRGGRGEDLGVLEVVGEDERDRGQAVRVALEDLVRHRRLELDRVDGLGRAAGSAHAAELGRRGAFRGTEGEDEDGQGESDRVERHRGEPLGVVRWESGDGCRFNAITPRPAAEGTVARRG